MMKMFTAAAALVAFATAGPALGGTIWLTTGGGDLDPSKTFTNGEIAVKATAFSIHDDDTIYAAQLGSWSEGLGVVNGNGDNSHTTDNSGFFDFIVFQFDQSVTLKGASFRTGWHGMNDTDATIGHTTVDWNATALPWSADISSSFVGLDRSALDVFGLEASTSFGNGSQSRSVNPGLATGNVWLISSALIKPDRYLDGFKIKNLHYDVPVPVPEPSTWAMLILGMGAVGGAMRRRTRAKLALA